MFFQKLPQDSNQSNNQSNFYSANIPGKARLSGATAKSVFNSKIEETVPSRFYRLRFDAEKPNRKHGEKFALLLFVPNSEEFSFIWV